MSGLHLAYWPDLVRQLLLLVDDANAVVPVLDAAAACAASYDDPAYLGAPGRIVRLGAGDDPYGRGLRDWSRSLYRAHYRQPTWGTIALIAKGEPESDLGGTALQGTERLSTLFDRLPPEHSVIFTVESTVQLRDFDYEFRVVSSLEQHIPAIQRYAKELNATIRSLLMTNRTTKSWVGSMAAQGYAAHLALSSELATLLDDVTRAGEHMVDHTKAGFKAEALELYLSTATHRLTNLAYHAENLDDVRFLRERLPAFNGHLAIHADDELTLDIEGWAGKTVVSVPEHGEGPRVRVPRFRTADPAIDLVFLRVPRLAFGSDRVDAAVFVADRTYFEGAPNVTGNLVMRRLQVREDRCNDEDFVGSVRYDMRCHSGTFPEAPSLHHYTIGLCPRGQQRVLFRSPAAAGAVGP